MKETLDVVINLFAGRYFELLAVPEVRGSSLCCDTTFTDFTVKISQYNCIFVSLLVLELIQFILVNLNFVFTSMPRFEIGSKPNTDMPVFSLFPCPASNIKCFGIFDSCFKSNHIRS